MSDRRRVVHPAGDGYPDAGSLAKVPRVAVVGGGIAGLSAATALAERGIQVVVIEREDYLGGRVGGWSTTLDDGSPVTMSRGFHAFFRQYYNLRNLLERTDPGLKRLHAVDDCPLIDHTGRIDGFKGLPSTPPLNAFAFVKRSPTFEFKDLTALNGLAALPLMTVSVPATFTELDDVPAAEFLRRINFPEAARHLAFGVFSRSFFADPEKMSAAELAMMFHIYFLGSSEGLVFDVPTGPYPQTLWNPLAEYLTGLGVEIRTGTSVEKIERGFRVDGENFDSVVLATDVGGLRNIVAGSPGLGIDEWRTRVASMENTPAMSVTRARTSSYVGAPPTAMPLRSILSARLSSDFTRRRSSSTECGWTSPSTPTDRRSSAPAAWIPSTTSASSNSSRTKQPNGPRAPEDRSSNCTRTPPPIPRTRPASS